MAMVGIMMVMAVVINTIMMKMVVILLRIMMTIAVMILYGGTSAVINYTQSRYR